MRNEHKKSIYLFALSDDVFEELGINLGIISLLLELKAKERTCLQRIFRLIRGVHLQQKDHDPKVNKHRKSFVSSTAFIERNCRFDQWGQGTNPPPTTAVCAWAIQ